MNWEEAYQIRCLYFQTPGKPSSTEINSNSLTLVWDKSVQNVTYYQVRYKCSKKGEKWKLTETDSNQNCLVITGLMAKTEYKFQVRGVFGDVEGPYSPVSGTIVTKESLATHILGFCTRLTAGHPSKHRLPAEENIKARNENARTRQLIFGIILLTLFFISIIKQYCYLKLKVNI